MNRLARHELAERTFAARHVRLPSRWVRASTTSPFDLMVLCPDGDRLRATKRAIADTLGGAKGE